MAIGKAGPKINLKKLSINLVILKLYKMDKLHQNYEEKEVANI